MRRSRRFLFTMSNSAVFFIPGAFLPPGFLPSSSLLRRCRPPARGLAERPETSSLDTCRAVTRDATLARHEPSRATGRHASRRSAVALSAQVPPPSPVAGSGAKAPRHQPLRAGCGAGLFVSAVTSRGRRHIPLRLQNRLRTTPLDERDVGLYSPCAQCSQYCNHHVFVISICSYICARVEIEMPCQPP